MTYISDTHMRTNGSLHAKQEEAVVQTSSSREREERHNRAAAKDISGRIKSVTLLAWHEIGESLDL